MNKEKSEFRTTKPKYENLIRNLFYKDGQYIDSPLDYETVKLFLIKYCYFKDNDSFIKDFYNNKYIPILKDRTYLLCKKMTLNHLFNIYSSSQLVLKYWTDRGYSVDDFNDFIKTRQNTYATQKERYISKYGQTNGEKLLREKLLKKGQQTSIKLKNNYKNNIGYAYSKTVNPETGNFYTLEESKFLTLANASKGGQTCKKLLNDGKVFTAFQTQFWINKGYTLEEAKEEIQKRIAHNGLKYYIEKYGQEKGIEFYKNRIEKYKQSCNNKTDEEKIEWNLKKYCPSFKTSKAATTFFSRCLEKLKNDNIIINEYLFGSKEYYLYNKETKHIYFYDFYDKDDNLLIEYHGIKFHPNPEKMTINEIKNWKSLFYNIDGITQLNRDKEKEELAIKLGYNFITIWEDYTPDYAYNLIYNKIIEIRNDNQRNNN